MLSADYHFEIARSKTLDTVTLTIHARLLSSKGGRVYDYIIEIYDVMMKKTYSFGVFEDIVMKTLCIYIKKSFFIENIDFR